VECQSQYQMEIQATLSALLDIRQPKSISHQSSDYRPREVFFPRTKLHSVQALALKFVYASHLTLTILIC
jgi:hypothetical protein